MKKYDNYKDSGIEWIGEIPNHWNVKRLKNIGSLYSGLSGKSGADFKSEQDMNTKPFINFTNVANNKYIVSDNFGFVTLNKDEKQNRVLKGDLLFLMSSENQEEVGKSSLLNNDFDELYLNSFCKGLRIKNDNIYPNFLNYLLNSSVLSQLVSLEGRGFTRINLRMEGIQNLPIVFPKFDEQTQIANYLDHKTDHTELLIAKKKQFINLLREERIAVVNKAVTKGLDLKVKMKDSHIEWLGEIPEYWEIKKLKYVANLKSGNNIISEQITPSGEYPVYGGNGLRGFFSDYTNEGNYVLIGRQGALCGNINYAKSKFWASEHAIVCHLFENYNWLWLGELLRIMNLNQYSQASAQPGLAVEKIKNLSIPVPSENEQNMIVDFITKEQNRIDTIISKTQQEIELLKEYKTALITDVVTGKVDVRNEVLN